MKKLFIILTILLMPINSTAALDPEQRRVIESGAQFFNVERDCVNGPVTDENDTPCVCKVGVDTTLSGNDNMEIIYNYMTGTRGLTLEQAAGFMGNIQHESTFNPKAVEGGEWGGRQWGGESDTIPPTVGPQGQPGYGLVQWTSPDRKKGLQQMSDSDPKRRPVHDIGLQLDYMWSELEGGWKARALDPLRQAKDVPTATKIIQDNYEVGSNYGARLRNAEKIYNIFKDKTPSTGVPSSTQPSGSCSSISGPGQDSKYVDGFLVYSQYDPAWKDKPYASSTIGESGCGPSAMAMIITALTGGSVKPPETADYAARQGLYEPGAGSKWTIGPVLAKNWGLKSQFIGADVARISATLKAGGLVIAAGQGPKPFTSGGHMIVIRAVTADGKFKIGDSGHSDTSDQLWDARQLVSNMADGSVHAITK